jgi:hypothetical protein
MIWHSSCDVSVLEGKTLQRVERLDDAALRFVVADDEIYTMYHNQDCCETVEIEELVGDLEDLVGTPILVAREDSNYQYDGPSPRPYAADEQWTFYNFRTLRGSVTVRWYGTSNGYYSTRADFARTT